MLSVWEINIEWLIRPGTIDILNRVRFLSIIAQNLKSSWLGECDWLLQSQLSLHHVRKCPSSESFALAILDDQSLSETGLDVGQIKFEAWDYPTDQKTDSDDAQIVPFLLNGRLLFRMGLKISSRMWSRVRSIVWRMPSTRHTPTIPHSPLVELNFPRSWILIQLYEPSVDEHSHLRLDFVLMKRVVRCESCRVFVEWFWALQSPRECGWWTTSGWWVRKVQRAQREYCRSSDHKKLDSSAIDLS